MSMPRPARKDLDPRLGLQLTGVAFLLVTAKLLSALKEILLARTYGIGPLMDAYQFIIQLVGWAPSIFLAICSAALVPAYAALRAQGDEPLCRFRAQVHGVTLLLGSLLALAWVLLCLGTPLLGAWSGLSAQARSHAMDFALPMSLMVFGGLYVALLVTEGISARLQLNNLLEATPAVILGGALLLAVNADAGLLVAATVGGVLAHLALLAAYNTRRIGQPRPTLSLDHPQWRPVLAALGALLVAQVLQAATSIVDQFWAARAGEGALSVMAFANRLLFVVVGIGSAAIARAALPMLADLTVRSPAQARQAALRWTGQLFALGLLGVLVLWPTTHWTVSIVFERGAFGAEETRRVAAFLQYSWLQVPPTLAALVLIQLVLAQARYRLLAVFAGLNLGVKLAGNALLVPHFGVEGLALSTSAMHLSTLLMLLIWWRTSRHD